MSDFEYKNKYLKYKKKYIELKNYKYNSPKLFGGFISELDERLLNMLEINKNVINHLKKINNDNPNSVKSLINNTIQKNPQFIVLRVSDTNEIFFISKKMDIDNFLTEFNNYLKKYNYFDNIIKIKFFMPRVIITKDNIDIQTTSKIIGINNIFINYVNKIKVDDIMDYLYKTEPDISRINKYKPVATLLSRTNLSTFIENYDVYTLEEKNRFDSILAVNGINLYKLPIESSQYIFYSKEFLLRLCNIFNITLDDGLRIVSLFGNQKSDNEMYFINCAFNNSYDIDTIIRLSNEHKINIELYQRFME